MIATFPVLAPIPEIGAQPGDYLVAEPTHRERPLVLMRDLPRGLLPVVLDDERLGDPRLELRIPGADCRVEITDEGRAALAAARAENNNGTDAIFAAENSGGAPTDFAKQKDAAVPLFPGAA